MGEIRLLGITEMKISAALLAATCSAEWTKPSYYDFIYKDQGQMRASGMANWGHPVVGSTRHWSDCPTLDVPEGALGLRCNAGTCALLCPGGSRATGRRRVRCRLKNLDGIGNQSLENARLAMSRLQCQT